MNNRIMAMLCALAAAMFLSIVPVKAEAAETAKCTHEHVTTVEAKAATCTKAGYEAYKECDGCGMLFDLNGKQIAKKQTIQPTGHDMQWEITETTHKKVCANKCGYAEDFGAKLYVENHKLTYKDNGDGTHTATCEVCGYEETKEHTEGSVKDCKCNMCGAELEHTYGNFASDAGGHWKNCTVCGKVHDNGSHVYGEAVAHDNTSGRYTHVVTCKVCGFEEERACADSGDDNDCVCDECGQAVPHSVENLEYVKGKVESCKEDGYYNHYKCPYCGKTFWTQGDGVVECDPTIKKLDHNWEMSTDEENHFYICTREGCDAKKDEEAHTLKYTSNTDGTHSATCTVCGREPAALQNVSHNYELAQKSQDGVGRHQMVCSDCKHEQWLDCVDENGDCKCDDCGAEMSHKYETVTYVAGVAASCEKDGYENHYECKQCGKTFYTKGASTELVECDPTIPATGHSWDYGKYTGDKHLVKCNNSNCDLKEMWTIIDHEDTDGDCKCDLNGCGQLVHSHDFVQIPAVAATCTDDGTEAYMEYEGCGKMFNLKGQPIEAPVVVPATGHDENGEWEAGENGKHVKKCGKCGEIIAEEDHIFENGNIKCTVCGTEENLEHVEGVDATCGKPGVVEHWLSKTGAAYADEHGTQPLTSFVIPALEHEYVAGEDNGDGMTHAYICLNCGDEKTQKHNGEDGCYCSDCGGNLDGHEVTFVEKQEATCEKAGHKAYYQCSCGKLYDMDHKVIEAPEAIAKLSHTTDGTVKKDAKEGKHYTECTTCGKKFYEDHVMAVKDPLKGNYHQYVCECGELKVEKHYDKDGDGVCDVCDHNMSSTSVTVEQHDNVTVKTGDSSTNKNYTWWRNWLEILVPSNSGGSEATVEKEESTASSSQQSASANQNQTASAGASQNSTSNSGTTSSGTNTGASETMVNNNALAQFFTWFLGLFGF